MNNQTEREAFNKSIDTSKNPKFHNIRNELLLVFQAGAAYQRSIDKGLVEALLDVYRNGFSPTRSERVNEALASFRAAQEGK